MLNWSIQRKVNSHRNLNDNDNNVFLATDINNPAHMNFGEAKLLQRIAEIETRLGQMKGNIKLEMGQSQSINQRKQIYY